MINLPSVIHIKHLRQIYYHKGLSMKDMTLSRTILIFGPDERLSELILQWLASSYNVVVANSPLQALQFVAELQPALLLLAYQVGEMSGIDLYDLIHNQQQFAHIPALIFGGDLTTYQPELTKRHLIGLSRPLDKIELMEVIHRILP
jgi:CheY-like chemotaxis protein